MRHISVPISCDQELNLDNQINLIKRINPDRVFITIVSRYQLCRGKMRNNVPMLYCICKENKEALAAAYFNCHDDEAENIKITLSFEPKSIRFINCNGAINGSEITIDYIAPYKTTAFEAEF